MRPKHACIIILCLTLAIQGGSFRPGPPTPWTARTPIRRQLLLSSPPRVLLPSPPNLVSDLVALRNPSIQRFPISLSSASSESPHDFHPTAPSAGTNDTSAANRLDRVLSRLTLGFPLYVVLAAVVGLYRPSALEWVNRGSLISLLLAGVMCGTGLTLTADDFKALPPQTVALGVACQFGIMPAAAWAVGKFALQGASPELFLGLCLVGCSPGGTASNLVSLIANADVALSVVLTACSTLLAVVVTPALVKLLVSASDISISGWTLVQATAKVVLGPVVLGMFLKARAPRLAQSLSRITPFASTLLVALICGGVVAQNAAAVHAASAVAASSFQQGWLSRVVLSVLALHGLGFAAGYLVPRWCLSRRDMETPSTSSAAVTARTISIEVGMQNSALAVVLARSLGGPSTLAALPGALSATAHSCLGSLLAAVWRQSDERRRRAPALFHHIDPEIHPSYGPQDPEFSI